MSALLFDGPSGVPEFETIKTILSGCPLPGVIRGCSYLPRGMTGTDAYCPDLPSKVQVKLSGMTKTTIEHPSVEEVLSKIRTAQSRASAYVNKEYHRLPRKVAYRLNEYGIKVYDLMAEYDDEMNLDEFYRSRDSRFGEPFEISSDYIPDKYTLIISDFRYEETGKFNINIIFPGTDVEVVGPLVNELATVLSQVSSS